MIKASLKFAFFKNTDPYFQICRISDLVMDFTPTSIDHCRASHWLQSQWINSRGILFKASINDYYWVGWGLWISLSILLQRRNNDVNNLGIMLDMVFGEGILFVKSLASTECWCIVQQEFEVLPLLSQKWYMWQPQCTSRKLHSREWWLDLIYQYYCTACPNQKFNCKSLHVPWSTLFSHKLIFWFRRIWEICVVLELWLPIP